MSPRKQITSLADFIKGYGYIVALGLVAFGAFAILFKEYEHPIYGHLDLGAYHVWIGVACIAAGIATSVYIWRKKRE